ncbi:MAG: serine protease [Deltaproteobacteria bacterium]|nr:serine protease [Deltaproteobacteria bacterium]
MRIRPGHLRIIFAILSLPLSFVMLQHVGIGQAPARKVCVIPVSGTVDPGMAAFIKRALEARSIDPNSLFIFELDTFGGRVDSALQIVDTLLSAPEGKTIAFVKTKAISAGALIALACSKLVMRQNTSIGDCAPITYSSQGPKMLGEKFQSPLRAKFRALAKRNGYSETLAESMVTAEMVVYAVKMDGKTIYMDSQAFDDLSQAEKERVSSKKTIVGKGELLTMTDTEAVEFGFSRMSVDNINEMLQRMEIENYELTRIKESWSETFVRFIGAITPLLLMIGLASLYMEIQAPGFGVLGIIGIICLALVFLNQYLVGLADYTELLLLILGFILLGFEVFVIPGFGIAGIAGILFIAAGAILAFQDFVIPDPSLPWEAELLIKNVLHVLGDFFAVIVVALIFLRYILPRFSVVVDGPYLDTTLKGSRADSREAGRAKIGDVGIAMTFLRPSGKAKIRDDIFDVITEGEFIDKGTSLKVLEIKGNRVIVSRKPEDE